MSSVLRLENACIGGVQVDVTAVDGIIAAIEPTRATPRPTDAEVLDLAGRVVMPPLVNGHAHLDKTFWTLPWRPHRSGRSVKERVAQERAIRAEETTPQAPRAAALGARMAEEGVGYVRSHVDIDTLVGLSGLEAVLEARAELAGVIQIQIVAFPQSGILADPGVRELMAEAMIMGADVVGGLDPFGFDGDTKAHLDVVFALAEKHSAPVDIHLHDTGRAGLDQIDQICARTRALSMQGRVTVSHAYALGSVPTGEILSTVGRLAEADVAIMTDGPVGTTPPLRVLRAAGVSVFSGSDGIRDAWSPYGAPGMIPIATQVAYQSGFRDDIDLEAVANVVTYGGARVLELPHYGIEVGHRADLVVFDAMAVAEIVATSLSPELVLRAGRVLHPRRADPLLMAEAEVTP